MGKRPPSTSWAFIFSLRESPFGKKKKPGGYPPGFYWERAN